MRRHLLVLWSVLFCWVLLAGCFGPPVANLDSQGKTVICLGDSLTTGVGASPGGDYPSRLSALLGREVINAGVNGDTTYNALLRLEEDVLRHDPLLVVILLGGNDFLRKTPKEKVFQNLEKIVERIQSDGVIVVLVGVQPGLFGDAYRGHYREVARKYHAAFIPNILQGIFSDARLKSDHIHPNNAGYARMAERIYQTIAPLLERNQALRRTLIH